MSSGIVPGTSLPATIDLHYDYASYFSAIDLSTLTPPAIIEELAYTDIFSDLMRDFVARDPQYTVLLESDPAPKLLEVTGYREHILRQAFNERAQQLLIAYALGTNLDHLGAFYGTYRHVVIPETFIGNTRVPAVMETDADFRKRIQLAPEAWSNAGPAGAYLYHTYAASPGVQNAVVYNNASGLVPPGTVMVVMKIRPGYLADDVVNAVRTRLFRDDIKPLTDTIRLVVAQPASFAVDATVYSNGGPGLDVIRTQARTRLYDYLNNPISGRDKVGMLVPFSGIISSLSGPFVERVHLRSPLNDFTPGLTKFANLGTLNLDVVRV